MRRVVLGMVMLCVAPVAWAHTGPINACLGHTAEERVDYPVSADGTTPVPSEPGEYHFQFSPQQMNEEVLPTLAKYRATHPAQHEAVTVNDELVVTDVVRMMDYGSFTVDGRTYDIWEYTRQKEAILHCRDDENVLHTGIARVRK